jgi:hypothetical protein
MNAPIQILATSYLTTVLGLPGKSKRRRLRKRGLEVRPEPQTVYRWSAVFATGPHKGLSVEGQLSPDEAAGALIRDAARSYATADAALDFLSTLFGIDPERSADVVLARAVRLAGANPARVHPGAQVEIVDKAGALPASHVLQFRRREPKPAGKGGAA